MSLKVEKTGNNNEVKLTFTVEAEKFVEGINLVYKKNANYFNIPGFRKGKAPMAMVEKQYGVNIFYEDAFNEIVPEIYDNAVKEEKLEVVSKPEIDIVQMEKGKELIFTAVVQTKPEVKLGKYNGISLKKIEYKVTDKDVEHELGHMAEKNTRIISVEDRPVKKGDVTVIDFEGSVDGVPFEGGKADGHELEIGSNTFIPGFEDQVIGMKLEEEKDVKVKFPDEYFSKDLAGKDAIFKVKVHEIKEKELPKIDDEFAKDVSEFDTLKELKDSIKEKIQHENDHKAEHETEDAAIKAVCDDSKIEIPSGMIENELDNMEQEMDQRLSYQGLNLEQYLQMIGKTRESFREESKEQATQNITSRLVLEAIIAAEKIESDEKEVKEKIAEMAKEYNRKEDELEKNEQLMEFIKGNLKSEKAIKFILDNAKIK